MKTRALALLVLTLCLALLACLPAQAVLLQSFVNYFTGSWALAVAIGDVNGDGLNDIVVGTGNSTLDPANDRSVSVFLQTTAGTLAPRLVIFTGLAASGVDIGDVTGDGRNDIVVAGSQAMVIIPQTATGGLGPAATTTLPLAPESVTIGDVTGDARQDIVLALTDPTNLINPTAIVRIYPQTAAGTLGTPIDFAVTPGRNAEVAVGDLNGDGLTDIVYNRGILVAGQSNLVVFYRTAGGTFTQTPVTVSTTVSINGIALGDVTGDGRRDIVFTAGGLQPNAFLGVIPQTSTGGLGTAVFYVAPSFPVAVALGDVTHDGLNDAVTLHPSLGNVAVFAQQAGIFGTPEVDVIPVNASPFPGALAVGDVNADGSADVAIAHVDLGLLVLLAQAPAPTVLSVAPNPGATGVPTSTLVTATFDQPMLASSFTTSTVIVTGPSGAIAGTVSFNALTRTVTFTPSAPLAANATCTARLVGGTSGIRSAAGVPLAADFTWTFTTAPSGAQAPTVTITFPANGATITGPVTVQATASDPDGTIARVDFFLDGVLRATDTVAPYTWVFDPRALGTSTGLHTISATATDNQALQASDSINVRVNLSTFQDVPPSSPFFAAIEAIFREGITAGCSSNPPLFCPNAPVTRRQMAVFIVRAMGQTPIFPATPTFADVPTTDLAYGYIERIAQLGITQGCDFTPVRRYCPNAFVTRAQMAVFVAKAIGLPPQFPPFATFEDVPTTSPYFGFITAIVDAGIANGCSLSPLLYCPNASITRAQMAVFLVNAFDIPT